MSYSHSCGRIRSGFTLIEALVALVIFGIISVVLSAALTGSIEAQAHLQQRQEQSSEVRAVFDYLSQDIQAAAGSLNNANSVFITGASQSSSSSTGPVSNASSLLTLSTMTQVMQDSTQLMGDTNGAVSSPNTVPQSASNYIRYDLNSDSGALTRSTLKVPNLQLLAQATPGQESTLAQHVDSLQFQFWDPNGQSWTSNWDYEQTLVSQSLRNSTSSSSSSSATPGNKMLPTAVQVTLVLRNRSGGTDTYSTSIPVVAGLAPSQPQNVAPTTATSNTGT